MKDRILTIMKHEGLTPAQFAEVIGVQRSVISHIGTGRNKPSLDVVGKILEKYPYVDPDWLLFGKGNMMRSTAPRSMQTDLFSNILPPVAPINPPRVTVAPEKRREMGDAKPQNTIKQIVQEPVVIKKIESRNISKIMTFYSDNTYETFIPEK
jgi:DNA-binding XRE family transcriptional regulator